VARRICHDELGSTSRRQNESSACESSKSLGMFPVTSMLSVLEFKSYPLHAGEIGDPRERSVLKSHLERPVQISLPVVSGFLDSRRTDWIAGMMVNQQDPLLNFPPGATFFPYAFYRNIAAVDRTLRRPPLCMCRCLR